jgi:murein DD-endopeptidase MepM/ murein hydrolase activator NlpD
MAVAVKPSKSLLNIRSGIKSIKDSFSGLRKNSENLNEVVLKKTKVKRESIARNYILSQRRKEEERRKNKEDLLEASSIGGAVKRQAKVIASSAKGFLGRIMDFLGTLLVGWLLTNLPSIITMAQELIARIQRLYSIVTGFFDNTIKLFRGFGNLLGAVGKNILTFDFTDSKGRVESALKDLGGTFDDMQSQFDEGFKLLTTSLGEGVVSGEDAAPFGTQYPNESMQEQPSGSSSGARPGAYDIASKLGANKEQWDIYRNTLAKIESGGRYDVPGGSGNHYDGRYQMGAAAKEDAARILGIPYPGHSDNINDPRRVAFRKNPELQERMFAAFTLANHGYLSSNQTYQSKETTEQKLQILGYAHNQGAGGAAKWLRTGRVGKDGFGTAGTAYSDALARNFKSRVNPYPNQQIPSTPIPAQTSSSPGRGITTTVRDELDVARNKSSLGGLTPGQGFGAYRSPRRSHAGIDIGTYGERGFYVSFKQSGTVTYAQNNGYGYGNLVIIKVGNIEFYFAHLAKIMVKNGQPYNGETIGEIGKSGGDYDIHLHFEARPGGKAVDPKPYLGLLSIGRQLTGAPGQPAQIATPVPAQIASSGTQQRRQASQQLAQRPAGPSVVIIEEEPPAPQPQVSVGGGGAMMIPIVINPLNSFITKKLLLDLAYT